MQCGVKELRRQEKKKEGVRCFKCGEEEHKKWECPKIKERRREEVAPSQEVRKKVKEHCGVKKLPPREAVISMEGWMMRWEVVTLVEYRECNYKGMKTQENRVPE